MSGLTLKPATKVADSADEVGRRSSQQWGLTDRCTARRPGWLCVVGCAVSDFSQPHCAAGHYMVRYTAPSAFEGGAR